MKKGIIILGLILLIAFTPNVDKKYHLELNDIQLNQLWYVIDNSSAPHDQVKQVQLLIQTQLKEQLPAKDSTKKK